MGICDTNQENVNGESCWHPIQNMTVKRGAVRSRGSDPSRPAQPTSRWRWRGRSTSGIDPGASDPPAGRKPTGGTP